MKIRELFQQDVTRDIAPVVYFHEQSPSKLQKEVAEYIITGGYPAGDPRAARYNKGDGTKASTEGIHEQFVHLLEGIAREMNKESGPDLPASWISGFYGSGKSSFAKLLGLSLDGVTLPDGTPLATALLQQDDSPRKDEFRAAWSKLTAKRETLAVVFDIGGVARDGEDIHAAVLRQLQARLGYCTKSNLVAEHELRLEIDGVWPTFLSAAQKVLKKSWQIAKEDEQADDHFSHVMHVMNPERFKDPTSWIDSRAGARSGAGAAPNEVVARIQEMLDARAAGKMLFLVVDEVSQYIHENVERMVKLQSFVSALGQKLKGVVWILATGQQRLEDTATGHSLGKLKDRFPVGLRVHLGSTNIRDVIHKRLLKKKPAHEARLRELFQKHRSQLRLYAYRCDELTEEDFVEIYPMLPEQIDLLMKITTSLSARKSRKQGDDHAIRGLLQLLGELFREQKLADGDVGQLVTIDAMYDVQHTALEPDVQTTLMRTFAHPEVRTDELAKRVAKAVALLELIQDGSGATPTTQLLIAQCLYARLGDANQEPTIVLALDKLKALSLVSYSEKNGYKIQSSAGQEWQQERDNYPVTNEAIVKIVQDTLKTLIGSTQDRAKWKNRTFPWAIWFSDGAMANDVKLQDQRDESTVAVDFRFVRREELGLASWVAKSDQGPQRNRILWVAEEGGEASDVARELARSRWMVTRANERAQSLSNADASLLREEQNRMDGLEKRVQRVVGDAYLSGAAYFRGQHLQPRTLGNSFSSTLAGLANRALPELYPQLSEVSVDQKELLQLLEKDLTGPSQKFLPENPHNRDGLGILEQDGRKYMCTCAGVIPARVADEIQRNGGLSGQSLIASFVGPPYGYTVDLIKACVAGLLRAKKIRVRFESGNEATSHGDPGVKDLFTKDREFRRAEYFQATDTEISPRDRVAVAKFFLKSLSDELEPEDEVLADAAFEKFPAKNALLRELERRFGELPGRPGLPMVLQKLGRALEDCLRSREMQKTMVALKRNLDVLRDGLEQLGLLASELTDEAIAPLKHAHNVREYQLAQLSAFAQTAGLEADIEVLVQQLKSERPWREVSKLAPVIERIQKRYVEVRRGLLNAQNTELDAARGRVKARPGFATLDAEQARRVLRGFAEAVVDTTSGAVSPTLIEVRDRFVSKFAGAEAAANDCLDEELSRQPEQHVVKVEGNIRGREVESRAQLKALFDELEERVGPHLDRGARVRIV